MFITLRIVIRLLVLLLSRNENLILNLTIHVTGVTNNHEVELTMFNFFCLKDAIFGQESCQIHFRQPGQAYECHDTQKERITQHVQWR